MDLRQLAALVAVADHRTFSAAAAALHTVQSNVSTHVARLERELGVTLVDRGAGTLTPEGDAVVARARRIQAELDALVADVASIGREVAGEVRLGIIGTTARWLLPGLLVALETHHPGVHAVILEGNTTSMVPLLVAGRVELAVVLLPLPDEGDVLTESLFSEDLVVVCPAGHPLAGAERLDVRALAPHPLLLPPTSTVLRSTLDEAAEGAGVTLRSLAEIDGVRVTSSLATGGFGPAVLPATAVSPEPEPGWRRIPLDGVGQRHVGLARRRRGLPSAPARAVRALLRQTVSALAPGQPGVHVEPADPPDDT